MNAPVTTGPREARPPVAKLPLRQVQNVKEMLMNDMAKQQLAAVAAKHMNPERMMRLMANALRTTPKLGECGPMSLLGAMMQCASLGLEPNTVLGHAYLIPFDETKWNSNTKEREKIGTNVQLIIGYKGLIDLARRSGHITSISANIHYSDDDLWEYEEGTEATLRHRPGPMEGEKLHAYAIAKFKDGGHAYVVLPWAQVMKIRDSSQGWKSALATAVRYKKPNKDLEVKSPWFTHEDEMAKKTAIRALSKYLPLSTEFRDAVEVDGGNAAFADFAMNPTEGLNVEGSDYIDGEYSGDEAEDYDRETGEVHQVEDQRAGQMTIEPEREQVKEPAQRQQRSATKAAEHTDPKPHDQRPQRSNARGQDKEPQGGLPLCPSLSDRIQNVTRDVLENLQDGAALDETLELFEAQLSKISDEAPDEYEAMLGEFHDFVKQRDA